MNTAECLDTLLTQGHIPPDSEVVSTNNKLVVVSYDEQIVARIGEIATEQVRDDPHDLGYSHGISWLISAIAPVVKPLEEHMIRIENYVISRYPLMNRRPELSKTVEAYSMLALTGDSLLVANNMSVRKLNIPGYLQERLSYMHGNEQYEQRLVAQVQHIADKMGSDFPFMELSADNPALVHGDCKTDNVVSDYSGCLMLIDLDAAAIGPRQYDLASWRLRTEMGDTAPVEQIVDVARRENGWEEDTYRALIGWKALSSMSFALRYGEPDAAIGSVNMVMNASNVLGGFTNLS